MLGFRILRPSLSARLAANGMLTCGPTSPPPAWDLTQTQAALIGPNAISAPPAFKHMDDNSAFRFHDRFEESEFYSAETAVMV
jgi:hypothetical protein